MAFVPDFCSRISNLPPNFHEIWGKCGIQPPIFMRLMYAMAFALNFHEIDA